MNKNSSQEQTQFTKNSKASLDRIENSNARVRGEGKYFQEKSNDRLTDEQKCKQNKRFE